jgi:RNA polymerase-binding transcription factor DksA
MSTALVAPATAAPPVPVEHQRFRALLVDLRVDCLRQREAALAESATAMPDPVAVSRAARLLRTVEEIEAALERIADGSYGSCVHCGGGIPAERLEFRPFASRCVACEQRAGGGRDAR